MRAKGSIIGVRVRKISIPRERKGEGKSEREKEEERRGKVTEIETESLPTRFVRSIGRIIQ